MKEASIWAAYEQRLQRVSAYIYDHLDEELDLDRLADIACLSPHHWHRIYRAVHGETLAATVKRLRLHRAAGDLVRTTLSVDVIARRAGYPNLQSFYQDFQIGVRHAAGPLPERGEPYGLSIGKWQRIWRHVSRYDENDCSARAGRGSAIPAPIWA